MKEEGGQGPEERRRTRDADGLHAGPTIHAPPASCGRRKKEERGKEKEG